MQDISVWIIDIMNYIDVSMHSQSTVFLSIPVYKQASQSYVSNYVFLGLYTWLRCHAEL